MPSPRWWIAPWKRGKLVDPLRREAVVVQRLELGANPLAFLLVGGEAIAPRPAERVARELVHGVERLLGPAPQRARRIGAVRLARDVVPRRPAAQGETAVASTRAFRDPTPVVDAHTQARLGKAERRAHPGHSRSDDGHVDTAVASAVRAFRYGVLEPVRVHELPRYTPS